MTGAVSTQKRHRPVSQTTAQQKYLPRKQWNYFFTREEKLETQKLEAIRSAIQTSKENFEEGRVKELTPKLWKEMRLRAKKEFLNS